MTTATTGTSSSDSTLSSHKSRCSSDSLASSPSLSSPSRSPPSSSPRSRPSSSQASRPPLRRTRSGHNLSSPNLSDLICGSSSSNNHDHTSTAGAAGPPPVSSSSSLMIPRRTTGAVTATHFSSSSNSSNSNSNTGRRAVSFLPPFSPPPPVPVDNQVSATDRRQRQRPRSLTLSDIDFERSLVVTTPTGRTKKVKRLTTTNKKGRGDMVSLPALSALSPFQQELEARWKAALATRRELEKQGKQSGGSSQASSSHQPLTRFASFSVPDATRPPPLNKADSLSLLVDHVVPKALHTLLYARTTRAQRREAKALCLPGTRGHIFLLWAACWVAFGAAFAKTVLSAVSPAIIEGFGISKSVFGALAGLPAISNIIAGPLGGALIDRMGSDKGCVVFALIVALGSACATLSLPTRSVALLASSQIIMGVGKGSLTTAQKVFLKLACAPGEMSFFFALSFSLTHLGTFLAFFVSPLVAESSPASYKASIWTSGAIAVGCLLCALPLLGKLKHVEPFLRHAEEGRVEGVEGVVRRKASDGTWAGSEGEEEEEEEEGRDGGRRELLDLEESGQHQGWEEEGREENVPVARLVGHAGDEGKWSDEGSSASGSRHQATAGLVSGTAARPPHLVPAFFSSLPNPLASSSSPCCSRQLSSLHQALRVCASDLCTWPFFFLLATTLCFYAAFMPFETFAVDFLKTHLNFSSSHASLGASLLPALSVLLSPPMGALVDKELKPISASRPSSFLRRFLWPPGSTLLWSMLLTSLGLLSLLPFLIPTLGWLPGFTLVSMGYAFSCASLWTTIPYFVPTRSLGLALGVIHAVDDAGILAVQVGIGRMLDEGRRHGEGEDWEYEKKVLPLLVFFALLACLTTLPVMKALKTKITVA